MTNEELWHRNLKLEIRHVEMKDELDAAKAEIERLKNELGDPRGEIDHAKSITSALDAEISTLRAENERLRKEVEEQCGWPCCDCDFDAVCGDAIPRMEKFTEARNKALDEASSHLRTKANEMRGDSPSNIADTIARIFEEQATAIEALKERN